MDIIYAYAACIALGIYMGWWIFNNWKNGRLDKNSRIPIVGMMMSEDPTKRKYHKARIADKALVMLYTAFCFITPSVWWFYAPLLLYMIIYGVVEAEGTEEFLGKYLR